jgi:hypothetical protein
MQIEADTLYTPIKTHTPINIYIYISFTEVLLSIAQLVALFVNMGAALFFGYVWYISSFIACLAVALIIVHCMRLGYAAVINHAETQNISKFVGRMSICVITALGFALHSWFNMHIIALQIISYCISSTCAFYMFLIFIRWLWNAIINSVIKCIEDIGSNIFV